MYIIDSVLYCYLLDKKYKYQLFKLIKQQKYSFI
ncbi:hypothetical protein K027_4473, partial [Acinetobacter baumannii 45057_1]